MRGAGEGSDQDRGAGACFEESLRRGSRGRRHRDRSLGFPRFTSSLGTRPCDRATPSWAPEAAAAIRLSNRLGTEAATVTFRGPARRVGSTNRILREGDRRATVIYPHGPTASGIVRGAGKCTLRSGPSGWPWRGTRTGPTGVAAGRGERDDRGPLTERSESSGVSAGAPFAGFSRPGGDARTGAKILRAGRSTRSPRGPYEGMLKEGEWTTQTGPDRHPGVGRTRRR